MFSSIYLLELSPNKLIKINIAIRWACIGLGSWWGKSLPSRWSLAVLRDWAATLGLRYGPNFYWRQQWGILDNERKLDPAIPYKRRRCIL